MDRLTPHEILNPAVCHCTPELRKSKIINLPFVRQAHPRSVDALIRSFRSEGMPEGREISSLRYPEGLFGVIARGAVKVYQFVNDAQFVTFDVLTEGDWFLYGNPGCPGPQIYCYPDEISTMTTTCLLTMDRAKLLPFLEADAKLMESLFFEATKRLTMANQRLIRFLSLTAEQKLAFMIIFLLEKSQRSKEYPGLIPFKLTKKDLASMLGLTLETVSRLLTVWEAEGAAHTGRGWVEVVNEDFIRKKFHIPEV